MLDIKYLFKYYLLLVGTGGLLLFFLDTIQMKTGQNMLAVASVTNKNAPLFNHGTTPDSLHKSQTFIPHTNSSKVVDITAVKSERNNASSNYRGEHDVAKSTAAVSLTSGRLKEMPLLTLFTSFKNTTDRVNIQTNTILNWAQFLPKIQPVAFTTFSTGILIHGH